MDRLRSPEAEMEKEMRVEENLDRMNGEMLALLNEESLSGNAGSAVVDGKPYSSAAANFVADVRTGEIVAFGNELTPAPGQIPMAFQIAIDINNPFGFFHIASIRTNVIVDPSTFSEAATEVLRDSVKRWNAGRVRKT